jgi:hypothetical protein
VRLILLTRGPEEPLPSEVEILTPTLTQRREELDMTEMCKIIIEKLAVDPNTWFQKTIRDGVETRQEVDPLNVKIPAARLDPRKTFSVTVYVINGTACRVR